MSRVTVDFSNSDRFLRNMRDAAHDGLAVAAEGLRGKLKRNMGSEGGTRTGNKRYESSPPGSFPGVRTNRLRGSIARTNPRRLSVLVGTNVKYGLFLEKGTARMAPRPWLLRTMIAEKATINRTFSRAAARSAARRVIR